jgi:hypothetical protein
VLLYRVVVFDFDLIGIGSSECNSSESEKDFSSRVNCDRLIELVISPQVLISL